MVRRTDLALEAKELWEESASRATELHGVIAKESTQKGIKTTRIRILDERGEKALHKPVGTYITLELTPFNRKERNSFKRVASVLGQQLSELMRLQKDETVLVVGLGNAAITPDAIGPKALEHLLITRHLISQMPSFFSDYRAVSALAPGVLGITGVESVEVVQGVTDRVKPQCMIVVDALASKNLDRICNSIQLSDTGITPGSGIQNARESFDRARFGIPVYALGVPTIVDMQTVLFDCLGDRDETELKLDVRRGANMMVTPHDIDAKVEQIAKLIAYGINLSLHRGLTVEDISYFVE